MLNLTDEQKKFIKDEFDVDESTIEGMNVDEWHSIREKCFDITLDELLDENDNAKEEVTDRCAMAESIMDIKYSKLFAK